MGVSHQHEVVDKVLKTAYASVASVVIFQAQDVLKLDSWARMNTPGTVGNNWRWRMKPGELTQDHINRLSWLVDIREKSIFVEKNRCLRCAVQCREIRKNGRFVRIKQTARFLEIRLTQDQKCDIVKLIPMHY